jgi:3-deoxy-7-phosphoheptulonate synthase
MIVMTEEAKEELRGPPGSPDRVRDRRIEQVVPLVTPEMMLRERPMTEQQADVVLGGRAAIARILDREDDRLLVVVGPCSVHDPDAALEYAGRLRGEAQRLGDDLCVAMRVYFEKPRTTTGWKGLINDPHLDGSGDVNTGLRRARELLLEVLGLGLPVGCEFLDPITPQYISDTVAWGAIGARTTESQIHRQLASGLSMPVGFKNRTDGDLGVAVDAVHAAAAQHAFAGIDMSGTPAILHTRGNPACHIILRGGRGTPNYDSGTVADALSRLRAAGLPERLVIDASHDNSGKDHSRQPEVAADVAAQIAAGNEAVVGTMLESFLVAGRQDLAPGASLTYGQSITDECMAWDTTVLALERLAQAVRTRRRAAGRAPSARVSERETV